MVGMKNKGIVGKTAKDAGRGSILKKTLCPEFELYTLKARGSSYKVLNGK